MALQHSPVKTQNPLCLRNSSITHYNSDPTLNTSSQNNTADQSLFITKRLKRTFDVVPPETLDDVTPEISATMPPETSNSDIITMFTDIKLQQEQLNNAFISMIEQNNNIQSTINTMAVKHDQLLQKINFLEKENSEQKNRIVMLEGKIESLEKYSRNTSIEIRNVPKQPKEGKDALFALIQQLDSTLSANNPTVNPIGRLDVRDIHRIKNDTILVDFTTVPCMESVLRKYRSFNRTKREAKEPQLNTEHLNITGPPRPVYIGESLTTKTKRLFFVAREHVKSKKLAAAWISSGRLLVKKDEDSTPIRISEESALHSLNL